MNIKVKKQHKKNKILYITYDGLIEPLGRSQIFELAKSGISIGLAGIFLESHPNPDKALCDGPSALPLNLLEVFLSQLKEIDTVVKRQENIQIS